VLAVGDISYPQPHEVAAPELAIDGEAEESEIANPPGDLKPDARRPDFLELERGFW